MNNLYEGKCHCGNNHFKISAEPEFQFVCYCDGCQKLNSSGHLCGIVFDAKTLIEAKDITQYTYPGGSGKEITLSYCTKCGTHLYAFPKVFEGKVVVRANTLINFSFKPQDVLFADSALSWDRVDRPL